MSFVVFGPQMFQRDVSVFFCCREACVAKKFLNSTEIRTAFKQMGGKSMP